MNTTHEQPNACHVQTQLGPSWAFPQVAFPMPALWDRSFTLTLQKRVWTQGPGPHRAVGEAQGLIAVFSTSAHWSFHHSTFFFFPRRKRILLRRDKPTRTRMDETTQSQRGFRGKGVQPCCMVGPDVLHVLPSPGF